MKIQHVTDPSFRAYGRIVTGVDCRALMVEMQNTPAPSGVVYVPSVPALEVLDVYEAFESRLFGGMPTQLGYCNGTNNKLNALEYHRDSEFNFAASDLIMLYGRQQDIDPSDFSYDTGKIEAFFVPAGTLVECYATTLHYAPCGISGAPFRCLIALPRGTNEPLTRPTGTSGEDKLLTHVNKWLIGHADSGLAQSGVHIGLVGENITLD